MNDELDKALFPNWIGEATCEELELLWLARFGGRWVRDYELKDDFFYVMMRLFERGMLEQHTVAPMGSIVANVAYRIHPEAE